VTAPGRGFASDNSAGVHPAVLESIARAGAGHAFGYGHDPLTVSVAERFRSVFGADASVYFVWGGTAANVLSLRSVCKPWHAVICASTAHLNVDEAGAPEAVAGVKLLSAASALDGRLTVESVSPLVARIGDEHAVQPRVLSISQATELGTVYSVAEVGALASFAHEREMLLHMDGARLCNAAASLGVGLRELTADAGVDVLSFGGTKNGLLGAEAVVFLRPGLDEGFAWLRKQSLQLASKMRFLAAQFDALLADDLWLSLASNANSMALRLASAARLIPGVTVTRPVESNAVFALLPSRSAVDALLERFPFYVWDEATGEVRWMCAWDTTAADVDSFAAAVRAAVAVAVADAPTSA
jgi:threonine aldolase